MEILIWLAVPLGLTVLAGVVVGLLGRRRHAPVPADRAAEQIGAALARPLPRRARSVTVQATERPSGVAVRSTRPRTPR